MRHRRKKDSDDDLALLLFASVRVILQEDLIEVRAVAVAVVVVVWTASILRAEDTHDVDACGNNYSE